MCIRKNNPRDTLYEGAFLISISLEERSFLEAHLKQIFAEKFFLTSPMQSSLRSYDYTQKPPKEQA